MLDSGKLVSLLGHSVSDPALTAFMRATKLRMPKTFADAFYSSQIAWNANFSLRFDIYRRDRYLKITGAEPYSNGDWIFGLVRFLGAGADDRIKADYAGTLPLGLPFGASPEQCIAVLGPPQLREWLEYYDTLVLAWVKNHINISIKFVGKNKRMHSFTQNIRGTEEGWARVWPDIFQAPCR